MSINRELIQTRCQEIADSLERLEKIKPLTKGDFLQDKDLQDIASYRLLVAIEAALSLCYHICAKKLKKVPQEYAECFGILAEGGIISNNLSIKLKRMARFRNMLVHMYWKVDLEIIFDIIKNNLADLQEFSQAIITLL